MTRLVQRSEVNDISEEQIDPIVLSRAEVLEILREVNLVLISLHQIGSYYMDKDGSSYERETTRFIDEWQITRRMASIRRTLTEKFDLAVGADRMDEIERALDDLVLVC